MNIADLSQTFNKQINYYTINVFYVTEQLICLQELFLQNKITVNVEDEENCHRKSKGHTICYSIQKRVCDP